MVWLPIMSVVVSLLLTHWKYHSLAVGVRDTAILKPSIYSDTICWMNISCWLLESSWRSYVVIVMYPMIIFVILHAVISLTYCPGLLGSRANRIMTIDWTIDHIHQYSEISWYELHFSLPSPNVLIISQYPWYTPQRWYYSAQLFVA